MTNGAAVANAKAARRARAKRTAEAERVRSVRHASGSAPRAALDWQLICRTSAAFFLVGAALIHAVWTAIHLQESTLEGVSFLLIALAQSALAFGLLMFPNRRTYLLAIALSLGIVGMWALSRTVGLPVGPQTGTREPVGMPDLMATLFELLTVLAVLPLIVERDLPGRNRQRTQERGAHTYALVGGLSLYTITLTAVAVVPAVTSHESEPAIAVTSADTSQESHSHASQAASRSAPTATVKLKAQQLSFGTRQLAMTAEQRVEVHLENLDDASHNFSVYRDPGFEDGVFNGEPTMAGSSRTYTFRSPAPGRYWFRCDLHPFMNGEVSFT